MYTILVLYFVYLCTILYTDNTKNAYNSLLPQRIKFFLYSLRHTALWHIFYLLLLIEIWDLANISQLKEEEKCKAVW